jgi:hypothetical protein
MRRLRRIGLGLTVLLATTLGVAAATLDPGEILDSIKNQAVFCEGTYALCIRAPCVGIPTMDRLGNYSVDHALCSCEVVKGWSMGPGACSDRAPVRQGGHTYMISTYSNLFNDTHKTLTCSDTKTNWAYCYGAPCVVDDRDPNKATCTCPVLQSAMSTLGGNCEQDACKGIWSAATPEADKFSSQHFYAYMQQNHPGVPVNKPAEACPVLPR